MNTSQFIDGVMQGLGLSGQNARAFFIGLAGAEGTKARNNPFATTHVIGHGEKSINSHGVKAYTSAQDGIAATVATFKLKYYSGVMRFLRADAPVAQVAKALSQSPYVGGSQAVRDRHAQNIVSLSKNIKYESPALAGNQDAAQFASQSTPAYTATLAPAADRQGVPTNSAVLAFANAVANWNGHNLTIGTGTNHNQYVKGSSRQSEHWTGNAADIPASGDALTKLGQDALIAAGMPEDEARTKTGGVFNVNGYQILFNTNTGGNHFNHLHIGVGRAKVPPVLPPNIAPSPEGSGAVPLDAGTSPVVFPFEDPALRSPFPEPGSVDIPPPGRNYAETWKQIGSQSYADPLSKEYGSLLG